jgi:hypothetical protein
MKKLSLYIFLVLMWCNVGFAECIKGDCSNGYGTFTWSDGSKYVGEHKDGKQHGHGTLTYADGRVEKGIWKNGQLPELKEEMQKKMKFRGLSIEKGFDFICYNECKERNDDAFCRQKCSIQ